MHLTAALFALVAAAAPHPFAGDWSGDIQVPGAPLAVTIHIADDATATLDIPAQQLKRQALEQVVLDVKAGRAAAVFKSVGATFDGTVSSDTWKGTFAQGPAKLPFAFTRTRKDVIAKQRLEAIAATIEAARATASVPGIGVGVVVDVEVGLMGDALQLTVPGQPVYALKHERGLRFGLANLEGYATAFIVDGAGKPTALMMFQPQGTVRLTPVAPTKPTTPKR